MNVNSPTPTIVFRLHDYIRKNSNYKIVFKKNGPIILAQIFPNQNNNHTSNNKIFINDYLCPFKKHLLEDAKRLKNFNFKFIWSKHGNVYARLSVNTPILRINNNNDFCNIENSFNKS